MADDGFHHNHLLCSFSAVSRPGRETGLWKDTLGKFWYEFSILSLYTTNNIYLSTFFEKNASILSIFLAIDLWLYQYIWGIFRQNWIGVNCESKNFQHPFCQLFWTILLQQNSLQCCNSQILICRNGQNSSNSLTVCGLLHPLEQLAFRTMLGK